MSNNQQVPDRLEGNEGQDYARQNLVQVVVDEVNWKVLHRDPRTGQYWKEFFPQSGMHGGGPPVFIKISEQEAKGEFKID